MPTSSRYTALIKNNILLPLAQFIFPALCNVCENPLINDEKIVCSKCLLKLLPLDDRYLADLLKEIPNHQFEHMFILYEFNQVFQTLIHLLKYQRYLSLAQFFAEEISKQITNPYDLVLAVPLHPIRLRERGYNQSGLIAQHVARLLDTTFSENALERIIHTPSQTKLNRAQRIKNMQGAFRAGESVNQKTIILIDDVITTGSTLNSCAGVLIGAGATQVDVFGLATPVSFLQQKMELKNPQSEVFDKLV